MTQKIEKLADSLTIYKLQKECAIYLNKNPVGDKLSAWQGLARNLRIQR